MKVIFLTLSGNKILKWFRKKVNVSARKTEVANWKDAEVLSSWKMLNFSHNFNWIVLNWDPECLVCSVFVEDFTSYFTKNKYNKDDTIKFHFILFRNWKLLLNLTLEPLDFLLNRNKTKTWPLSALCPIKSVPPF